MVFNVIMIILLLLVVAGFIYMVAHTKDDYEEESIGISQYSIEYLANGISDTFNNILKTNVADLNLNRYETEKREKNKSRLRIALRSCSHGEQGSKEFVKEYIKDILMKEFNINEENINQVIPFNDEERLTEQQKFEILLYVYQLEYGMEAANVLFEKYSLDQLVENQNGEDVFEVFQGVIDRVYQKEVITLTFPQQLDILAQFIYMKRWGNSVVDTLLDMKIDGIFGGVSGVPSGFYIYQEETIFNNHGYPYSYDSVWIFLKGKMIYLSFLSFGTQKELERICKNIYNNGNVGQLSERNGYRIADLPNGARVTVCRPPLAESWCFLVRKHENARISTLEEIITEKNSKKAITLIKALVKGRQALAVTGSMGSGKTALIRVLLKLLNPTSTLRIDEQIFELGMRKQLPHRNIITFRDIESVETQEVLDMMKKTDGNVTVIGEVASAEQTDFVIQKAQIASDQTMFTSHHNTTESLVSGMRNDLLKVGGFHDEKIAEEQVVHAINFDLHMVHDHEKEGHRYLERITEIVPAKSEEYPHNLREAMKEFFERMTDRKTFKAVDIIVLENGKYVMKNDISKKAKKTILQHLKAHEKEEFLNLFKEIKEVPDEE